MMNATRQTLDRWNDDVFNRENAWTVFAFLAAVAGASLGRKLMRTGWQKSTGRSAPMNPDADDASWPEALSWGIATGALVGILRMFSRRGASAAWKNWIR